MNKLITLLFALFLFNNCSFNEKSKIWNKKEKDLTTKSNIKKIFFKEEFIVKDFNQNLKLDLSKINQTQIAKSGIRK